ncbi:hypothetical protein BS50DRAFT_629898 [Corynespora cassiicola Philippines]|uniref:DUF1711-domain-containing protein n=1 Tax=Corynespora cassiicola Philippines TaxID=1448308 RepID=A0A2T2P260_CORCC|nr:hypothetical protein BS50DRAFT_629898 [Corynespora cassiicola Philippines]
MSASKSAKAQKTVILKLSPDKLEQFLDASDKSSQPSKPASSPGTPAPAAAAVDPTPADTPTDSPAALNGPSTPSSMLAPPAAGTGSKRKGVPGPKPGAKRGAAAMDGTPKPRGKPGPKKKQKLGDMINDPNNKGPFAAPTPIQKLGPKANQGAINAGLRALDRTGKKCRKWEKKGFQLRSFTGVSWAVPTWRAPKRSAAFSEDVKSDSTGSSDTPAKVKDESSAVSDKSGANGDAGTPVPPAMNGLASSPAPVAAPS